MGHHTVVTIYVACEFQFELDLEFAWDMLFEDARLHNVGILTIDIFIAIYINIYTNRFSNMWQHIFIQDWINYPP